MINSVLQMTYRHSHRINNQNKKGQFKLLLDFVVYSDFTEHYPYSLHCRELE